jgi:hypothetical protein
MTWFDIESINRPIHNQTIQFVDEISKSDPCHKPVVVFDQWRSHMYQFYSQSLLGFDIVKDTHTVTS